MPARRTPDDARPDDARPDDARPDDARPDDPGPPGRPDSPGPGPQPRPRARDAMFAALAVPNFRRYISGQAVSLVGRWPARAPKTATTPKTPKPPKTPTN